MSDAPTLGYRGGELVRALERAWSAIRANHSDVPEVVMVTGRGSSSRRRDALRFGHYAAGRWHPTPDSSLAEVMIGGEGLERTPHEVLATLLHEAAHAVAQSRGIQDTSRQGRYHNSRFREIATELGLRVERHPQIGWSLTTITVQTSEHYRETVDELDGALDCWREREQPAEEGSIRTGVVVAICDCPRRIRLSASVLERGQITCGICHQPFTAVAMAAIGVG